MLKRGRVSVPNTSLPCGDECLFRPTPKWGVELAQTRSVKLKGTVCAPRLCVFYVSRRILHEVVLSTGVEGDGYDIDFGLQCKFHNENPAFSFPAITRI
jgi:hypothetical protein